MATRSGRRKIAASLSKWMPRHSIIGRIVYPILGEGRSLPAVMTWIGFFVLIAFIAVALLAPVLAPYDPYAFVDAVNVPPWANAPILANETYFEFSPSLWVNMTDGQQIDLRSAYSTVTNDSVVVTNFPVRILRGSISAVAYVVWLEDPGTTPGHFLEAKRRIGSDRWLHAAQSNFHDIVPTNALGIDNAWVNRRSDAPGIGNVTSFISGGRFATHRLPSVTPPA